MTCLVVLLCTVAAASAYTYSSLTLLEWTTFKLAHQKNYDMDQDSLRMKTFLETKTKIAAHNLLFQLRLKTYTMGVNQYSDTPHKDFVRTMNGYNANGTKEHVATFMSPAHVTAPEQMDWRQNGAVSEVKNQANCGSCWAFSATGSLEGQHFRKTGSLVSLSEQNLIDCSGKYNNNGCQGGAMDYAFMYIRDNGGIDTEDSYPYEAVQRECRYNPSTKGAEVVGFIDMPAGDEGALMEAVATVGPISVAIDASQDSFQHYRSGVYYEENCSSTNLDHGVLVVGYGRDAIGGDYWLVKNSWGTSWGEEGYIKIARNRDNHCGIATFASYPLV